MRHRLFPEYWEIHRRRHVPLDAQRTEGRRGVKGKLRPHLHAAAQWASHTREALLSTSVRIEIFSPRSERILLASRAASSECPPNSKKLSSNPTCSRPNTSANKQPSVSSSGVRIQRLPLSAGSGAGNPFRSSFPFAVKGIRSSRTYAAGTMYSGNLLDR